MYKSKSSTSCPKKEENLQIIQNEYVHIEYFDQIPVDNKRFVPIVPIKLYIIVSTHDSPHFLALYPSSHFGVLWLVLCVVEGHVLEHVLPDPVGCEVEAGETGHATVHHHAFVAERERERSKERQNGLG
jgi:hypothetical protein